VIIINNGAAQIAAKRRHAGKSTSGGLPRQA